jgi:hypothetical protein
MVQVRLTRALPGAPLVSSSIALAGLGELVLEGVLGEGRRCVVHAAEWRGRPVALRLHRSAAVHRHAERHATSLARFEHDRNVALHDVPGLRDHVAQPLGYIDEPGVSALIQERLEGVLYRSYWQDRRGLVDERLEGDVGRIVALAHAAGIYDLDLHAQNVMVVDRGRPTAVLFDFNMIPWQERAPNPLVGLLLRARLLDPGLRDRRRLRRFHDISPT